MARRSGRFSRDRLRIAALVVTLLAFASGVVAGSWLVRVDRMVRNRFEGRLFRIPSRVYSAPVVLYPGLDLELIDLEGTLERLAYRRESSGIPQPGGYVSTPRRVRIHLRAFKHPSRAAPARDIELRVDGSGIESIQEVGSGRELGAVLLEPEVVGSYHGPDREQRELVRLSEVPRHLVDAVLAVEDQRFLAHHGIDWRRVGGALWANLRSGSIRQGASTLTQQLVKNFFLTSERTWRRKAREAVMALLVEARYEKLQILEAYLNEIYLGQRGATAIHGVGEAARHYFGKRVADLTVAESALLAAIIQSPGTLSPFKDLERAQARRDLVLALMWRQGRFDEATYWEARAEPLVLAPQAPEPREARYFLDALRRQLPEVYDAEVLSSEGLRVHSTLDVRLQKRGALAVREGLEELERRHPWLRVEEPARALEACLVALRPQTGEVLALVGGRDYRVSQFDRCTQARRPAGSAFKPFVYLAALEPRRNQTPITLASQLDDSLFTVPTPSGPWSPANYDREFHGWVSMREALERSLNVATARLAQQVGIERVAAVARRLGITSELPLVPSLALGTAELAPLEMARAYGTLANGGIRPAIRTFEDVVDTGGRALERQPIAFERVLDPGVAFLTVSLLEGVVERGTARALRATGLHGPVAAKTGTSDEERDAWFVGFTPELVVVVWVGFDEPRSLGLPASVIALPIWLRFAREATGGRVRGEFLRPAAVVERKVDPDTGGLAVSGCPEARDEFFLRGTEPTASCPEHGRLARGERGSGSGESGILRRFFEQWLGDEP